MSETSYTIADVASTKRRTSNTSISKKDGKSLNPSFIEQVPNEKVLKILNQCLSRKKIGKITFNQIIEIKLSTISRVTLKYLLRDEIEVVKELPLNKQYKGLGVRNETTVACSDCKGKGIKPCSNCNNQGYTLCVECCGNGLCSASSYQEESDTNSQTCHFCGGSGRSECNGCSFLYSVCEKCAGKGQIRRIHILSTVEKSHYEYFYNNKQHKDVPAHILNESVGFSLPEKKKTIKKNYKNFPNFIKQEVLHHVIPIYRVTIRHPNIVDDRGFLTSHMLWIIGRNHVVHYPNLSYLIHDRNNNACSIM